jgi:hypothetical protein
MSGHDHARSSRFSADPQRRAASSGRFLVCARPFSCLPSWTRLLPAVLGALAVVLGAPPVPSCSAAPFLVLLGGALLVVLGGALLVVLGLDPRTQTTLGRRIMSVVARSVMAVAGRHERALAALGVHVRPRRNHTVPIASRSRVGLRGGGRFLGVVLDPLAGRLPVPPGISQRWPVESRPRASDRTWRASVCGPATGGVRRGRRRSRHLGDINPSMVDFAWLVHATLGIRAARAIKGRDSQGRMDQRTRTP